MSTADSRGQESATRPVERPRGVRQAQGWLGATKLGLVVMALVVGAVAGLARPVSGI